MGNVNKESSWSYDLYDEPWIYRQKENVIPKETFCSHKILKETVIMSSPKKLSAVKKSKRNSKNVITKQTEISQKYKRDSGNTDTQKMSSLKKPAAVKKYKRDSSVNNKKSKTSTTIKLLQVSRSMRYC